MFGFGDILTFALQSLIILPLVGIIHATGHTAMAYICGGRADLVIGIGNTLFSIGRLEIKRMYFVDSFCTYKDLRWDNRFTHILVYSGGLIFNIGSSMILNALVFLEYLEPSGFAYQYVYYSLYYVFISLLPVQHSDKEYSDGLAIYRELIHRKQSQIKG